MEFRVKRILSLLTAILEGGIFSGVLIGWSSLVYILKKEGEPKRTFGFVLNKLRQIEFIDQLFIHFQVSFETTAQL